MQVALSFREGQSLSSWRREQLVQGEDKISVESREMAPIGYGESKRMKCKEYIKNERKG